MRRRQAVRGDFQRLFPTGFTEVFHHVAISDLNVPRLWCVITTDKRFGHPVWVRLIIKAETPFDAQTIIVCWTITSVGRDDFVVFDVIGDLTADATERATAINFFVWEFGAHTFSVEQTVFHQRTGRARLDTLAATDAG